MSGEQPDVVQEDDQDEPDVDESDGADVIEDDGADQSPSDVQEATVDLSEDDLGGGSELFDGVDDSDPQEGESGSVSDSSGSDDGEGSDGDEDDLDANVDAIEETINEGLARLGVVGLDDDDFEDDDMTPDDLEEELNDVFAAFQVGHFGARFAEEYILQPADGDVDPTWGLLGSLCCAVAMIVWMRPDGDEQIEQLRDAIQNIGGGA